ncbi:MAG: TraC family protein [Rickettsiales bacterium]
MKELFTNLVNETRKDLRELRDSVSSSQDSSPEESGKIVLDDASSLHNIKQCYAFRAIDPDTLLLESKNHLGFILKLSPFSGIDQKSINTLNKIISYELPDDAVIQVINYASPKIDGIISKWGVKGVQSEIYRMLTHFRAEFYENGNRSGLWGKGSDVVLRNFELYFSVCFTKKASIDQNLLLKERIIEIRKKLEKGFRNIGCFVEQVNQEILNSFLTQILLPEQSRVVINDGESILNATSNSEYVMHPEYIEVDNGINANKYLIFEVGEWPKDWSLMNSVDYPGFFQTGRGIPYPFYMSLGYKSQDMRNTERKTSQMRIIRTNQTSSKLATFFPAMREEMEDWHFVTQEIDKGAKLAKAAMYVVAIIQESDDEKVASQNIQDHFYQLGFRLNQIKYDCLNNLINTLPLSLGASWPNLSRNKVLTTMLTSSCLNLMPIFSDAQNDITPLMMLVGRRGQVFFFDNYAADVNGNYNMVVVGKSGSGKSVFLQEYMTSILRQGGQVVVIDDGRSFQNSCKIIGGDFIDFSGEKLCINPFSLYQDNAIKDEKFKVDFEEPLIDLIVSILCIVTNIDKNNTKNFDVGLYRDVLKKSVQIVLSEKGSKGGVKDVYEVLSTSTKLRTPQTKDIADSLAYVLREYAEGRYSDYYNNQANLSIENLLTIFELSSLESNEVLQTSVLLMVVFLVYVKMQGRTKRTSLVIDEAWRLLRHDAIKGFIEGIARRARKYNGNLVVATQSISDFEEGKSAAAAAVLSQSDWRVLLSAEGKDEKILKDQLGMEKPEIGIAKDLKGERGRYSEMMIRHSSGSWQIGRLILDPFSAKLYSSKASDVVEIQRLQKQGLSLAEAINHLTNEENS